MSRPRQSDGSALVMVLVFVTLFGALTVAILDLTGAGLRTATTVAQVRDDQHAIESAVHEVIATMARDPHLNGCPTYLAPGGDEPSQPDVQVSCIAEPSGFVAPRQAIVTLGGEGFVKRGAATLTVEGDIASAGRLAAVDGKLQVIGDALAPGGECEGTVAATGTSGCRPVGPLAFDWDPAVSGADLADAVEEAGDLAPDGPVDPRPTCAGSDVVTFAPALYSATPDVVLSWWSSIDPGALALCATADTWHFLPGWHYFQFPAGPARWTPPASVTVVGGTLGTDGECEPSEPGVQFVFGGESRLAVGGPAGRLDLCGDATLSDERIALGLTEGSRSNIPSTAVAAASVTTATGFTNPDGSRGAGGPFARTTIRPGSSPAGFTLAGFDDLPAGAHVTAASLEIRHREDLNGVPPRDIEMDMTWRGPTGASTACVPRANADDDWPDWTVETCDLALPAGLGWRELKGSEVDFAVSGRLDPGDDDVLLDVDAIRLVLTYVAPGLDAHRCPVDPCWLLESSAPQGLGVHGAVYAPTGRLSLELATRAEASLSGPVVVEHLDVDAQIASTHRNSPFAPEPPVDRRVVLTAQVGGDVRLQARVWFFDADGGVTSPGHRVEIVDWVVRR